MKLTVTNWVRAQNQIDTSTWNGRTLSEHIEHRTFRKDPDADLCIDLNERDTEVVFLALARADAVDDARAAS